MREKREREGGRSTCYVPETCLDWARGILPRGHLLRSAAITARLVFFIFSPPFSLLYYKTLCTSRSIIRCSGGGLARLFRKKM